MKNISRRYKNTGFLGINDKKFKTLTFGYIFTRVKFNANNTVLCFFFNYKTKLNSQFKKGRVITEMIVKFL